MDQLLPHWENERLPERVRTMDETQNQSDHPEGMEETENNLQTEMVLSVLDVRRSWSWRGLKWMLVTLRGYLMSKSQSILEISQSLSQSISHSISLSISNSYRKNLPMRVGLDGLLHLDSMVRDMPNSDNPILRSRAKSTRSVRIVFHAGDGRSMSMSNLSINTII